jgi:hypothetical protein
MAAFVVPNRREISEQLPRHDKASRSLSDELWLVRLLSQGVKMKGFRRMLSEFARPITVVLNKGFGRLTLLTPGRRLLHLWLPIF